MLKIEKNRKFLFNALKLLGAVLLLYLGLTFNVFDTGEKLFLTGDILQKSQVIGTQGMDIDLQQAIGKHSSSRDVSSDNFEKDVRNQIKNLNKEKNEYKIKFQRMCISNMSLCSKIIFNGEYNYKEKYMYLASSIYVLSMIEDNVQFGKGMKNQLKEIVINNTVGSRRGYATWDRIEINLGSVSSYIEFFELLGHEMGHIVDLGMVVGFDHDKNNIYTEFGRLVFSNDDPSLDYYKISWKSEKVRKSGMSKEDFCSGYGMSDPFEDFAECHNLYLNHNMIFKKIAKINDNMKQKYNFMANLYGGKYLFDSKKDLSKIKYYNKWRPWDTTRM